MKKVFRQTKIGACFSILSQRRTFALTHLMLNRDSAKQQCNTSSALPDLMAHENMDKPAEPPTSNVDVGELTTAPATQVKLNDLCGPWLMMADKLQGELFIRDDGFVSLRPPPQSAESSTLLNSIGRIRLFEEPTGAVPDLPTGTPNTVTLFRIDLETYVYDRKSPDTPPFKPTHHTLSGVVSTAYSQKADYRTLTMAGNADHSNIAENRMESSQFYAAKLVPWEARDQASSNWCPKKDVKDSFDMIFGHLPLNITSHINRAVNAASRRTEDPTTQQKGSPCHLDLSPYRVSTIPSIYYIPNYISVSEHDQFMSHLQATPETLKTKLPKRTCQEWGGVMCDKCNQSFLADTSIPPWAEKVNEMLLFDGIFSPTTFPNSVRIHEYEQGEGIGPHCDGPIYVPLVAVLSLASTSVMHFYPRRQPYTHEITEHYNDTFKFSEGEIGKQEPIASVVMEPGSLLLFTDEVFTHHPHGVSDKAIDDLRTTNCVNRHLLTDTQINEVKRTYRASVTVRNLLPRCEHFPEKNEYMMRRAWYLYNQLPPPPVEWDTTSSLPETSNLSYKTSDDSPSTQQTAPKPDNSAGSDFEKVLTLCRTIAESQVRLGAEIADIKHSLDELKSVVGYTFTSANTFQKETSSILNHLSMAVLDISNKQEETADDLRVLHKSIDKTTLPK